ncbi:cyclin E-interacting protein minus [Xylocopa sonorina]|uniref:cyclin E-interacting protein minus n=1 Tax=Xylocopa sonorina TaxID=1818115 RepID=UPI00403ACEE2
MDCCYLNRDGSPTIGSELPNISSPEMFNSDYEDDNRFDAPLANELPVVASPKKPSQADLVAKSDNNLLARINKFLCGVPPPPKLTICRTDCSELLLRIYENKDLFWTPCVLQDRRMQHDVNGESPEQQKENISTNSYQHTKSTPRNLSTAFDACDPQYQSNISNNLDTIDLKNNCGDNFRIENVVPTNEKSIVAVSDTGAKFLNSEQVQVTMVENKIKQVSFAFPQVESLLYYTVDEKKAATLVWPEAYHHKYHGIHYNRNKAVEEFESLTSKLCERYIGAETQSTCTVWFSKPAPGSAKKRNLLAKRNNGQSPGKRLNHLTRRRKVFSSANLQGLALNNKKLLVLNIKKPTVKKGKSPRGKSPRGKSPRGTPKSSTKKKVARRLILDGPSPLKTKIETSKRALFQSPPPDRAGPSKSLTTGSNPQSIKRALFTQNTKENDSESTQKLNIDESRKRKSEEELEGPRCKWAKSLSFDCSHELHNTVNTWDRHSSSNVIEKSKSSLNEGRCELSDAHRKKLLWAVAEALRSKGIGMTHPQFKHYATNLARTIKKYMPDLENKNIPRKPGSTSDRMLKLAKHHVVFVVDARPAD